MSDRIVSGQRKSRVWRRRDCFMGKISMTGSAVQDRDRNNLPPYAYGIVKVFFACESVGGAFVQSNETSGSAFFSPDELPPLAEEKYTREQIEMCFRAHKDAYWKTQFD